MTTRCRNPSHKHHRDDDEPSIGNLPLKEHNRTRNTLRESNRARKVNDSVEFWKWSTIIASSLAALFMLMFITSVYVALNASGPKRKVDSIIGVESALEKTTDLPHKKLSIENLLLREGIYSEERNRWVRITQYLITNDCTNKLPICESALIKFEEDFNKGYTDTLANVIDNGGLTMADVFTDKAFDVKRKQLDALFRIMEHEAKYNHICDEGEYKDFLDSALMDAHEEFDAIFSTFNDGIENEKDLAKRNEQDWETYIYLSIICPIVFFVVLVMPSLLAMVLFCGPGFENKAIAILLMCSSLLIILVITCIFFVNITFLF
jgi:hypothetical protein